MTEEQINESKERKIGGFKSRYKDKSINELKSISNSSDAFDSDAIEAANRLIAEKEAQ